MIPSGNVLSLFLPRFKMTKDKKFQDFILCLFSLASGCSLTIMVVLKKHGKINTKCYKEIYGYQNQEG
jgi:hypothetical protein